MTGSSTKQVARHSTEPRESELESAPRQTAPINKCRRRRAARARPTPVRSLASAINTSGGFQRSSRPPDLRARRSRLASRRRSRSSRVAAMQPKVVLHLARFFLQPAHKLGNFSDRNLHLCDTKNNRFEAARSRPDLYCAAAFTSRGTPLARPPARRPDSFPFLEDKSEKLAHKARARATPTDSPTRDLLASGRARTRLPAR